MAARRTVVHVRLAKGWRRDRRRPRRRHDPCNVEGMSHHVAVWLDHHEARVFHLTDEAFDETTVRPTTPHAHVRRRGEGVDGRPSGSQESARYYHEVAQAVSDADEILVVGPGAAKRELLEHVHWHDGVLEPKFVGMEVVQHPSDSQIVAFARRYFLAVDRLH